MGAIFFLDFQAPIDDEVGIVIIIEIIEVMLEVYNLWKVEIFFCFMSFLICMKRLCMKYIQFGMKCNKNTKPMFIYSQHEL